MSLHHQGAVTYVRDMQPPVIAGGEEITGISVLAGEYQRRQPERTVLYRVVQEHYRTYASLCEEEDRALPAFVRREFEKYLACGILSEGFARVRCGQCGYDRLVGFSCKRRGFCPGCTGRRMNDGAAFLTDRVIGDTPIRHWVLSLPPPLRYLLAYDASLVGEVLSAFIAAMFGSLRWKAKDVLGLRSVTMAHPGAVTAIQRSSSHLALNVHFHSLVTDGVFVQESPDDLVTFHALPPPVEAELTEVAWETCRRTRDILQRRGLWQDDPEPGAGDGDPLAAAEPGMAATYQASLRGVLSSGPRRGRQVVRFFGQAAREDGLDPASRRPGHGFDLHARQGTHAGDRAALERFARYVLRPPLAQGRLDLASDGRVVLHMKRPWRDGTAGMVFEPLDFLSRLTALIPRPKMNTLRFHGIYASHARLREQVVPEPEEPPSHRPCSGRPEDPIRRDHRLAWAELLARVYRVDVFRCPRCSSRTSRIAWVTVPDVIRRILHSVGLATDSPALHPPRTSAEVFGEAPAA